jgi:hypothetical protein
MTALTLTLPKNWTATAGTDKQGLATITLSEAAPVAAPTEIPAQIDANGAALLKTDTLVNLLVAVATGGTLLIPKGHYSGTGNAPQAMTMTGAGIAATTLDATGCALASGKALVCPMVTGMTIEAMTLMGAACPDNNGAGIRGEGTGISFVANNVLITGCQNGVLTWGSPVLTGCTTENNGAGAIPGADATHEMYFDADAPGQVVTLNQHISTCGMLSTHALKTRALSTVANGGTFSSGGNSNGNIAGSIVDVPDGGLFTATGATFVLKAGSANTLFLGYGEESANNAAAGVLCALRTCVFVDQTGTGGSIQNGGNVPSATLDVTGSTYTGPVAPQISGFATVVGTIVKAG